MGRLRAITKGGNGGVIIGQFCETYPPTLDGVGRVMLAYCKTLDSLGHRGIYVAPANPRYPYERECETLLYPSITVSPPYRVGIPSLSGQFFRASRVIPFDIVHAHSPFLAGRAARRIARRRHIPLVATFHSKYYDDFYRTTHSKALSRLLVRYVVRFFDTCDEVWTLNNGTAKVLREYGYKGDMIIMPNGTNLVTVDDDVYKQELSRFPLREGVPTMIFVGQMDKKKNPASILDACALLRDEGMDFQLVMVGEGQDLGRLKEQSARLGLDKHVIFTGFLSERNSTLSLYRRSDLFVFPSLYDNAPMVVREAASMGTPSLLVRDTCSAEGIVHGDNGFLCDNTPQSIAQAIKQALPVAKTVGQRARQTIPIPWDRLIGDVLARYQLLIDRKRERSHA